MSVAVGCGTRSTAGFAPRFDVLVTNGSQRAVDLAARVLLRPIVRGAAGGDIAVLAG
jgi:hypothetical protein